MTNAKFTSIDSWAIWDVPNADLANMTPDEREKAFGANYQPNHFPMDKLNDDIDERLKNTKYVIVGMNQGNAAVNQNKADLFLNFHGNKGSMDYRLAAVLYNTELWGSFMTDVSHVIESSSKDVDITQDDVINLENHLDNLGISKNATLVALGGKVNKALTSYAKRPVKTMYHYSGSNNRYWKADKVHEQVMNILEK
ncbi:MAG TPA: hypothetical protein K8V88_02775 [Companilactobacillus farciminis]|uniref:Uncharacterized protein n=1 Tax=Companilactobacillus farciminis TaxID=1612 RepID=A0A921L9F3_9LACO|nr:hypothetical protein [Companilactobacillus farciminis]